MIKIEKEEIVGFEPAIRGMRNPMNSWDKSDSKTESNLKDGPYFVIGEQDLLLMAKLSGAGSDHRKFMRMITVYVDITAPLYWWKEFDTYKVGTVANSCSTMHKIHSKEFVLDDFSYEKLILDKWAMDTLNMTIDTLNKYRDAYIMSNNKDTWYKMIQLLPTSYNQKRTIMLNYEVLSNIYNSRRHHKLDEWRMLCEWIEKLPHSTLMRDVSVE